MPPAWATSGSSEEVADIFKGSLSEKHGEKAYLLLAAVEHLLVSL